MTKDSPQTSVLRDAPKRIWAGKYHGTWWQSTPHHQMTPYILATPEALAEAPEVQALIAEAVEKATRVKPLVWLDFASVEMSPDESVSDDNLAVALCSYFDKRLDCPDDDEDGGELDDYDCWKVWVSENSERVLRRIAAKANRIVEARIRAAIATQKMKP